MVLDDQDWALPQIESISPNNEELLLLDWILCSASGLIPGATLEDLTGIKSTADTAACDIEVLIASA